MRLFNNKGELISEMTLQDWVLLQTLTDSSLFHVPNGDKIEILSVALKEAFDNLHDEIVEGMRATTYHDCIQRHTACIALYTVITEMTNSKTGVYENVTWKAPDK